MIDKTKEQKKKKKERKKQSVALKASYNVYGYL